MNKSVTLKKSEDRRIASGHLWAFSNEIHATEGDPQAGDVVALRSHSRQFLGKGFYNPHSLIAVRVLTRQPDEEIDFQYFHRRIETAHALRKKLYPKGETYRLVHGESDFLPGLIVDKYNDYLSVQTFSFGMDKRLTLICDVLESLFHPKGIVERNEAPIRTFEGLEQREGILRGTIESVVIAEYGIKFCVDLRGGQKTGFFLDQRENRKSIRRYAQGNRVLDCFCNVGGFALNAAYAEASEVVGIDASEPAIRSSENNARLNDLHAQFIVQDAFEYLREATERKEMFDLIVLDPPSFAKNRKAVKKATLGYKEIHGAAMRLLKRGGILATGSCSHHVYDETFLDIVSSTAHDAGRSVRLLEWRGAAQDHPVLPTMPETRYLKFGIFCLD